MAPNPGYVFVSVTGSDHKGDKKLMPKLRQHVMLHHLRSKDNNKILDPSQHSPPEDDDKKPRRPYREHATRVLSEQTVKKPRQNSTPHHVTQAVTTMSQTRSPEPIGSAFDPFDALPVKGIQDIGDIFQWFYSGQANPSSSQWRNSTRYHWLDKHWDLTRQDEVMFNFTLCFALEKKAVLTGASQKARIFYHRSSMFAALKAALQSRPDALPGQSIAAIAGLAYIAIRDEDYAIARVHLDAVKLLARFDRYDMHIWLYVIWCDLRVASATFATPTLAYYVPEECRADRLALSEEELGRAARLSAVDVAALPFAERVLDVGAARDVLRKMHEASAAVDKKDVELTTLYGHLYDLKYRLCLLSSRAWAVGKMERDQNGQGEDHSTVEKTGIVKCVLLAAHLYFWAMSFYVVPQGGKFMVSMHRELRRQLRALVNAIEAWKEHARLESLLWVLFVGSGSALDADHESMPDFLRLLKGVLDGMGIKDVATFERKLQCWPWTTHSSQRLVPLIWAQVTGDKVISIDRPPQQVFWIEEMATR